MAIHADSGKWKERRKKMRRKTFAAGLVLIALAWGTGTTAVLAQPYPAQPIQIVVPNDPGSAGDTIARQFAEEFSKVVKTPVTVLNKPGASSTLGTDFVVKSKKDGYTLLYANTSAVVYARATNPEIVPYDPGKDLEPLGLHCFFPLAVAVQANSRWKTFNELIDYAKKNPGGVSAGLHGQGSIDHFNLELIKSWTETQFNTIPFKGTAATLTALLGGHVDTTVIANSLAGPHVKSGQLKFLILTNRMREYPDVPTITELGYKRDLPSAWFAWFAPAGIPEDVKKGLVTALERTIKNPEVEAKVEKQGFIVSYKPPEELRKLMATDYETARAMALKLGLSK
jgi:tripartite-type tricarboxylate transporter receptor subunit TctC